ncbi:retinitis pigmentosa 1-like 1 protein [Salarias fasciatus]|uniref:retinitis pigmentosa 1-like 1 protein n=1 Tax=Salarias fasciatus TaxID=181472 RepID=UPI001176B5B8|nr:retinitis pigmentosa 1-like 1 protein [Salarias fasciatus]
MQILVLLSLSLTVALGSPLSSPDVGQQEVLPKDEQRPLLGDLVPVRGHVEVEDPAPQAQPSSKQQPQVQPEAKAEEPQAQPEVKAEDPQVQPEAKAEPQVQPEAKADEPQVQPEAKAEDPQVQPEAKAEEPQVQPEAAEEPEVEESEVEQELNVDPEEESEDELLENPDLQGESEVEVEPGLRARLQPEDAEEAEAEEEEGSPDYEEAEGEYEAVGEEEQEPEPLDDDQLVEEEPGDAELAEAEQTLRRAFLGPDAEVLPQQRGAPVQDLDYSLEADPELDEGLALDAFGQPLEDSYFPDEEERMMAGVEYELEPVEEEEDQPVEEDQPKLEQRARVQRRRRSVMDQEEDRPVDIGYLQEQPGRRLCPGVLYEGKCYQFFREPRRAADAEFFCQRTLPNGHLASITSQHIHRAVVSDIKARHGVFPRTWVGGLRFLNTGRFVWLDGSHWGYEDWLRGEPNHTAGLEDCLELLPTGNGKFNDFTCWERQAFICSYTF